MKNNINAFHLNNQVVLLRIDANIPIINGIIIDDHRLLASEATINLLLDKGAQVVLLTHLGRPHEQESNLSTRQLIDWFHKAGYEQIQFAASIQETKKLLEEKHSLILFENVRFFKEEREPSVRFAQQLASLATYYINDAFGSLHRHDTSIVELPLQFDAQHKSIGLLVEHELKMLDQLTNHHQSFSLIIGGGKASDKVSTIHALLPKLSLLCVGPNIVFNFLKAEGKATGKASIAYDVIPLCKEILMQAKELKVPIHYPIDYVVTEQAHCSELEIIDASALQSNDIGISIGPKTAHLWSKLIIGTKTIVYNGLMGSMSQPEAIIYLKELFNAIAHNGATSIIAGGDSVAAAYYFNVAEHITYLSTGGGATLAYISDQELPGLAALKDRTKI